MDNYALINVIFLLGNLRSPDCFKSFAIMHYRRYKASVCVTGSWIKPRCGGSHRKLRSVAPGRAGVGEREGAISPSGDIWQ